MDNDTNIIFTTLPQYPDNHDEQMQKSIFEFEVNDMKYEMNQFSR